MQDEVRIVVAEDESIIAIDISKTLEHLGYKVLGTSRTGLDTIKLAKTFKPDLVLMDIVLEDKMSGIEAAEIIINELNIPVVYLTAMADDETIQSAKITEPFGYVLKPFDERTLHSAIEMALYKYKINQQLKERTKELEEEKVRANRLLHNIFPNEVVRELQETGTIKTKEFPTVTLLFTDFQGFTEISSDMHPQELVTELNDVFKNFDSIIAKHQLEKLKTMGDSYMIAGGFPKETNDHAFKVINAAIEMQEYLKIRNCESKYKWEMRAGIHSGSVVAGVVGKNKYTYDVWGNTVNIASAMERHGLPGRINITSTTFDLIKDCFDCSYFGSIDITGNGKIEMYLIEKRRYEEKNKNTCR